MSYTQQACPENPKFLQESLNVVSISLMFGNPSLNVILSLAFPNLEFPTRNRNKIFYDIDSKRFLFP